MAKKEKPIVIFEKYVSQVLVEKLQQVKDVIDDIDDSVNEDVVANILEEANSLISFACGTDDALYEEWRYRFLIDETGKRWIIQAREIGVDPRDWSGKQDPED